MISLSILQAGILLGCLAFVFYAIGAELTYRRMRKACEQCGKTFFDCDRYGKCCHHCTHN